MLPYEMIAGGTFVATVSTAVEISLQSQAPPDFFIMRNITEWGLVTGPPAAQTIEAWWERSMAQGTARFINQTSSATAPSMIAQALAANGVFTYSTSNPPVFPGVAATAINATTGVVTVSSSATFAIGDTVRIVNPAGMLQVGGLAFTVTAIPDSTHITLGYIGVAGAGVNGTTASIVKFIPSRWTPPAKIITNITKATQAVITFSTAHSFIVGEEVSFRVPSAYGMDEMNNRLGIVQSTTISSTVNSITVDIDSSGFTTFAYPASGLVKSGPSPAMAVPAGSGPYPGAVQPFTPVQDAFDNKNTQLIYLGAGLFGPTAGAGTTGITTGDVFQWTAFKYSQYNGN